MKILAESGEVKSIVFCCDSMSHLHGLLESHINLYDAADPYFVMLTVPAGVEQTYFNFCPFCGAKIEVQ